MGSYTGTVPSFPAGSLLTASKLLEVSNFMTAVTDPYDSYAPTWTASAGTPGIGNGTLSGRSRRLGRIADVRIKLTGGSTTTYGTAGAYWQFSLPSGWTANTDWIGPGQALDSGVAEWPILCKVAGSGTVVELFRADTSGRMLNNAPFTFGTGDSVVFSLHNLELA